MKSLDSQSGSPRLPCRGQTGGHKITDFDILPYISFINAFTALECIKRYWETICAEFIQLVRFTP